MAESLCGPSNALQNFQKHTSVDRSLQQDRLAARQNQIQSFRSGAGHNTGLLDPEFEAFQAGLAPPNLLPYAPLSHLSNAQSQHQYLRSDLPTDSLAWASEFQKLHVSDRHIPAVQQHQSYPIHARTAASWHQEFQSSMQPVPQASVTLQNSASNHSQGLAYQSSYFATDPVMNNQSQTSQWKGKEKAVPEDEAMLVAFEKEFEAHAAQLLQEQVPAPVDSMHSQYTELKSKTEVKPFNDESEIMEETPAPWTTMMSPELEEEILKDLREEAEINKMDYPPPDDPDELAETAGQLLKALSDNTSQKFKESSFLSLMRKLRDREVRVEGDSMVDVDVSSSPHPSNHPFNSAMVGQSSVNVEASAPPLKGNSKNNHDDSKIPSGEQDDDVGRYSSIA